MTVVPIIGLIGEQLCTSEGRCDRACSRLVRGRREVLEVCHTSLTHSGGPGSPPSPSADRPRVRHLTYLPVTPATDPECVRRP